MLIKIFTIWVLTTEIVMLRPHPHTPNDCLMLAQSEASYTFHNTSCDEVVEEIKHQINQLTVQTKEN